MFKSMFSARAFNMLTTQLFTFTQRCPSHDYTTGLNDAIARLENYSTDSNLALNAKKTKWTLLPRTQMSRVHSLDSCTLNVNCKGDPLKRVQSTKLLGLHFDQHLTWNEHITKTLASCYGTLAVLRKLKHMAPYHVRKQLAECLVISKLDYACSIHHQPISCDASRKGKMHVPGLC